MENREAWLADTMIELADSITVREPAYLETLARRFSELVTPAEIGLLVTTDTGSLATPAASTPRMRDLMALESRYREGPCTTCHGTGQYLRHQALDAVDNHWPRYGPAARGAGFTGASAYPLRRGTEMLGAVCVLDPTQRSADELEVALVDVLVDASTIGLSHQRAYRHSQRRVEQLQGALHSRVVIEQAKGILAYHLDIDLQEAFLLLRHRSRSSQRLLEDVAVEAIASRGHDYTSDSPRG